MTTETSIVIALLNGAISEPPFGWSAGTFLGTLWKRL